jgi:transcriptional regulator GlxA family with amidase domain
MTIVGSSGPARADVDRIQLVLEAVADDPAGDHSARALAERAGVSVRHLQRLFVQYMGTTPARHVKETRLATARSMLETSAAPLADIAARAGFGSPETMRRAFVRSLGRPPGAYRAAAPGHQASADQPLGDRAVPRSG